MWTGENKEKTNSRSYQSSRRFSSVVLHQQHAGGRETLPNRPCPWNWHCLLNITPPSFSTLPLIYFRDALRCAERHMGRKQAKRRWKRRTASKEKESQWSIFTWIQSWSPEREDERKQHREEGREERTQGQSWLSSCFFPLFVDLFLFLAFLLPFLSALLYLSKLSRSYFYLGRALCVTRALWHRCRDREREKERQTER